MKLTSTGTYVDEKTNKDFTIIEMEGTQSELYNLVLKNLYSSITDPQKAISQIENEMISVRCAMSKPIKYAGITHKLDVQLVAKIEFKDKKMKVSVRWNDVWYANQHVGVSTFLSGGGLKCFNKQGEISSEKRYNNYNPFGNELISILTANKKQEEEEW